MRQSDADHIAAGAREIHQQGAVSVPKWITGTPLALASSRAWLCGNT